MRGSLVSLRARSLDDVAAFHELWNDEQGHLLLADGPFRPTSPEQIKARFEKLIAEPPDALTGDVWLSAEANETGEVLGNVGLWGVNPYHARAHLGLWLRPSVRGRGFGTDIVALLCEYGFRYRNLRRLIIDTLSSNAPMRAVAQKAGFRLEGTLRRHVYVGDEYADAVVYGLLREEWRPVSAA
jgi:RimJ/RimL family protein N-acetyltransferase